ncbi:M1 family aminopeptidase [Actinomycetospora lutea]|uniref:M1 family aminopeptidase n=1 Tax=Actinomycetospora lutea TaxID=663604 RepID=UPI002365B271|nr:M1 family aminopeptidase [Actinomycetospora lutea]MDD7939427.1 M1 family aminopeptidase [Actinomycetospora lutea]
MAPSLSPARGRDEGERTSRARAVPRARVGSSPRARLTAVVLVLAAVAAACGGASTAGAGEAYADAVWPQRPVVELGFDVAPDLRSVTGTETVRFTPDLEVCELVFRAWPNTPTMATAGSSLTVTDAAVDDAPVAPEVVAAGAPAGAPGTMITLPLPGCVGPGTTVTARLGFRLVLGVDADERVASSPSTGTAWFGSGYPLLAWERGRGWAREPAVPIFGESATSEAADTTVTVTAPQGLAVLGPGEPAPVTEGPPGRAVHGFRAPALRDVAVAVGRYTVLERDVDGVRLRLATPQAGTRVPPAQWADALAAAITAQTRLLGPFPYPWLTVAITPGQSDGTEFPAALQFGDVGARPLRALVAHEVAHEWFYALVGNDQARDPWLDESFATAVEALSTDGDYSVADVDPALVGRLGEPMSAWAADGGFRAYVDGVYAQGAAALLAGRAADPEGFDTALRGYVAANAHRVVTPAAVQEAFAGQPAVLDALTEAGAFTGGR